jgi:hypothetical protein
MRLFLYMAGFIVVVNIVAAYSASQQGIPLSFGPTDLFLTGLVLLLVFAWWLSRERKEEE